jgi:hypothetical protein
MPMIEVSEALPSVKRGPADQATAQDVDWGLTCCNVCSNLHP